MSKADPKIMRVSKAAQVLGVRPQAIHALIRSERVKTYELGKVRGVHVDEVQEALGSATRGRPKTNLTPDDVAQKFGFGEGSLLYTVVEIRRRVQVVDKIRQETVQLKSAHDESQWGGMSFMPGKLAEDLEAGNIKVAEDNRAVLTALIRSYRINGNDEIADALQSVKDMLDAQSAEPTEDEEEVAAS